MLYKAYCTICHCHTDLNPNWDNGGASITTPWFTTKNGGCPNQELVWYIGDGYCDDSNNNKECDYDGGDCCGDNVNTDYCNDCQCLN